MNPQLLIDWLRAGAPGGKTAFAVAGLVTLALTQVAAHNYDGAAQSLLAALGLAGVRHAIATQTPPAAAKATMTFRHEFVPPVEDEPKPS